jgi:glycerol-3-phosphate dehydrogenase
MTVYDVAVIGGGLLGCFVARNLKRWNLSASLIEQREDVCTGFSRANSAIIYPGYDNKVGSLKANMTVKANAAYDILCRELDVPFSRCGSLMVSFGKNADKVLQMKYQQGLQSNVPGLRLLSGEEAREMEPELQDGVSSALYAPTTGTVNPWELCIGAYENAVENGVIPHLNTKVLGIRMDGSNYVLQTDSGDIRASVVINCGGINADKIQELCFPPSIRLRTDGADYLVLDKYTPHKPKHIIMHEPEDHGKGLTAIPTVEGTLLLGPSSRETTVPFSTTETGLNFVREAAAQVLPQVKLDDVIRSFGGVRPNPYQVEWRDGTYMPNGKGIGSFVIETPGTGFWSLIGIKTPGLTCANELGSLMAEKAAAYLHAEENPAFSPCRTAIPKVRSLDFSERAALVKQNPDYGEIVCWCEDITKEEILEAIRRGAVTIDGVKRRVGAMMGRCQGARCQQRISEILAQQLDLSPYSVTKDGGRSFVLGGKSNGTV